MRPSTSEKNINIDFFHDIWENNDSDQESTLDALEIKSIFLDTYISENPRDIHVKDKKTWIILRLISLINAFYSRIDTRIMISDKKKCIRELVEDDIIFTNEKNLVLNMIDDGILDQVFSITGELADGDKKEKESVIADIPEYSDMTDVKLDDDIVKNHNEDCETNCDDSESKKNSWLSSLKDRLTIWQKNIGEFFYQYFYAC